MRPLLCLTVLLCACAPVRENNGDLPYCEDDEYEPSNTEETAWEVTQSGLTYDLILCPGNEDWFTAELESYGYIELYIQWADPEHVGILELIGDSGIVGTTEGRTEQQLWLSSWEPGNYWIRGALPRGNEAEEVTVQIYVENDVVIGR